MTGRRRAHIFHHVPFEGPGSIEPWLTAEGFTVSSTRFFQAHELPGVEEVELLIVLGGPMSVNDEADYAWLAPEKRYLRAFIEAGKPVLGICLGAQLIAAALGSRVYPNREKEIGWFPIEPVSSAGEELFSFPGNQTVFHWHGETFDLPVGAKLLARSRGCENQAFQLGSSVIGLQFHLETTPESAAKIVAGCRNELVPGRYLQAEEEMLAASPERYRSINALMGEVLAYLARKFHESRCAGDDCRTQQKV